MSLSEQNPPDDAGSAAASRGPTASLPGPLASAIAIGLITGLIEAGLWILAALILHHYTHRDPQLVWAAPLALAMLCTVVTLPLLAAATPAAATRARRTVIGLAVFVGTLELTMVVGGLHPLARCVLAAGVGVAASRLAGQFPRLANLIVTTGGKAAAVVTALAFVVQQGSVRLHERQAAGRLGPAHAGAPNILLLILDTMRASDMSLYGASQPTTPRLAALGKEGVVFTRAYSPSSWTLPSHASIFTGRHAHEVEADWSAPLEAGVPTLAEVLGSRGYLTAGFAGNPRYTTSESGLSRGFSRYHDYPLAPSLVLTRSRLVMALIGWISHARNQPLSFEHQYGASEIADDLLAWLPRAAGRPWFAFINAYDTHDPYEPSLSVAARFRTPGAGPRNPFLLNEQPVSVAEAAAEHDAYDAVLAQLDADLGVLFDSLRARGALANTMVIVVGDHGEMFGEHGLLNHGNSLYAAVLHVPLLVVWPGHVPAGVRIDDAVSARDVAATISDLSGSAAGLPGRTLARHWDGRATWPDTVLVSARRAAIQPPWHPIGHGDMAGVIVGRYQLIRERDGKEEAYDLIDDPLGLNPVDPSRVPGIAALRAAIPAGAIRP